MMDSALAWLLIIAASAGFFLIGLGVGASGIRKFAIENGAAFYSINPTNGVTKFEWRKCD